MPSVAVLPSPAPAFGPSLLSKMQNGYGLDTPHDVVADIKAAAKEQAQRVRGASATSLLRSAREQIQVARVNENEGDVRAALSAYTKAASLAAMFMETTEFRQERPPGKKGVLTQDLMKFQQGDGRTLSEGMERVEGKLAEILKASSRSEAESEDTEGAIVKSGGGSIADRLRALQSAGLSTNVTSKRISRELHPSTPISPPSLPTPTLPEVPKTRPQKPVVHTLPSPMAPSTSTSTSSHGHGSPIASSSTSPSPPSLVPVSSFGPPSPTSSASSSPRIPNLNINEFNHNFPSIDELDELDGLKISMPSTSSAAVMPTMTGSSKHSYSSGRSPVRPPQESQPPIIPVSPMKAFPALSMDVAPRPSSTPIPSIDTFSSRPASPSLSRSPISPIIPKKPSNLPLNAGARSPLIPSVTPEKRELPTSFFPHTLYEFMKQDARGVLILDVRSREEFDRAHIRADAVVCIEPSVLLRDKVSSTTIEDSLVIAPSTEQKLFASRDQFDVVVVCDEASKSIGESPALNALMRAVYELEFKKVLRNMPVILVGGVRAWQEELGLNEMVGGSAELALATSSSPTSNGVLSPTLSPPSLSPTLHMNGTHSPSIGGVLVPSPRMNGMIPPLAPLPSPSFASASITPVAPVPIPAHVRAPAESSASAQFGSPPLAEASIMGRSRSGTEPAPEINGYRVWKPPANAGTPDLPQYRPPPPTIPGNKPILSPPPPTELTRRPAISRPPSHSISSYSAAIPDHAYSHRSSPSLANAPSPIQYPTVIRTISSQTSGSSFGTSVNGLVSIPPQASINPSPLSRRRSDYIDQSQEALSNIAAHPPIDYPDLSSQHILRPPPAVASSSMERQDNRPRIMQHTGPKPPTIHSEYPVTYWADIQIGTSGLKNLGNTCYMNSTIQCLSATVPFARFFTDGRWKSAVNMVNPMGSKGQLAQAFAYMLRDMWQGENQCLTPLPFRRTVSTYAKQFAGSDQHDSQEFLSVLLDGLHEDLNRVLHKPNLEMTPEREAELERLPTQLASEQQWQMYRMRDDSLVVDFFQGQYRSRLECLTCHKTSTTYNTFMYLTLPIPSHRGNSRLTLQQCLDAFVKEEVMEKSDAWNCPNCKALRKATKLLSLARLPPVLLIHLKRFSVKGHFTEKIETCVDFPLKGLDLTNYMPAPLPPGVGGASNVSQDDPRAQLPPYRYDLYGVTNHFGTLSSGHYTAFISSRGGWLYCDDSRITAADPKDVVGKPAYILFYKRTKA